MMSGTETNHEEGEEDTLDFNFMHQKEINSVSSTNVFINTGSTVSVFRNKELLRKTRSDSSLPVHTVGDKVCSGAERTEIKSSTTNTGEVQTDEDDTVTSTTTRTTQT